MTTLRQALTMAIGCHNDGRLTDAAGIYRLVLTVQPDNPVALNNLALLAEGEEAIALLHRALAVCPSDVRTVLNLGRALQAADRWHDAAALYRQTLEAVHDEPELHFALAYALQRHRQTEDAARHYQQALALHPDHVSALCNLATLHTAADQLPEAAELYRRPLAIDPDVAVANMNLAGILDGAGRLAEAQVLRERVPCPQPPIVERATGDAPTRTVLILASSKGNIPLDELLPLERTTRITWHMEYATEAQHDALPPYDVALNSSGNADTLPAAQVELARFHAHRSVLNPPAAVARTRRDRLPALLAGIPDVVVPPVVRLSRQDMAAPGLAERLFRHGITCPVLIRPIVGHGGQGMDLVSTADQLDATGWQEADAYYAIAFYPFRSIDGYWRKYRTIFIDRQPFAYHLAISPHWLVHYATADMLAAPWKRQEERRFLEHPAAALGPRASAALQAIGERLDLDFAGIDYTLLPDGQLLVFEANATMLVHGRDDPADFPYKARAVANIFTAFDAMLDRAQTPPALP